MKWVGLVAIVILTIGASIFLGGSLSAAFGGRWIYQLERTADGTKLTVTEDGWIDNKFIRTIARVIGYHRTLDSYLTAIGRRLGSPTGPVHDSL
jgi:hypothetical protein